MLSATSQQRLLAANASRRDLSERLVAKKAELTEAKASREKAEEDLFAAIDEASDAYGRGQWPADVVGRVSSCRATLERRSTKHEATDREKRRLEADLAGIVTTMGDILDAAERGEGLFDAIEVERMGGDAWRAVEVRDVAGRAAADAMTKLGVRTVGDYLDAGGEAWGRKRVSAEEISADVAALVAANVARWQTYASALAPRAEEKRAGKKAAADKPAGKAGAKKPGKGGKAGGLAPASRPPRGAKKAGKKAAKKPAAVAAGDADPDALPDDFEDLD